MSATVKARSSAKKRKRSRKSGQKSFMSSSESEDDLNSQTEALGEQTGEVQTLHSFRGSGESVHPSPNVRMGEDSNHSSGEGEGSVPAERLLVPGLLYTIQNNLIYVALGHLEVVTFQVLYQAKLVITAVLLVLCLGQRFTSRQWLALVMLMFGVVSVELSGKATAGDPHRHKQLRAGIGVAAALGSVDRKKRVC